MQKELDQVFRDMFHDLDEAQNKVRDIRHNLQQIVLSDPGLRENYMRIDWDRLRRDVDHRELRR